MSTDVVKPLKGGLTARLGVETRAAAKARSYRILAIVASHYGVSQDDVLSKNRGVKYSWPRQVAMTLIADFAQLENWEIGEMFACHRTGVTHNFSVVRDSVEAYPRLMEDIKALMKKVQAAQ